jgi:hypothetical protein
MVIYLFHAIAKTNRKLFPELILAATTKKSCYGFARGFKKRFSQLLSKGFVENITVHIIRVYL